MSPATIYALAGVVLFGIALYRLVTTADLLRRVVALNIASSGAAALLVTGAFRATGPTDPVPHALVITGIVVVVSTTAVALALIRRLHDEEDDD
jgi:multicomponent Na+:H+ antiporter subunit C